MTYIDGFLLAVPNDQKEAYRLLASEAAAVFKDHGALSVMEAWGDDVPDGQLTSFPMAVKLQPNETVVFSWIIWPSKAVRDEGQAKAIADARMTCTPENAPFDAKRMIFGCFTPLVEA